MLSRRARGARRGAHLLNFEIIFQQLHTCRSSNQDIQYYDNNNNNNNKHTNTQTRRWTCNELRKVTTIPHKKQNRSFLIDDRETLKIRIKILFSTVQFSTAHEKYYLKRWHKQPPWVNCEEGITQPELHVPPLAPLPPQRMMSRTTTSSTTATAITRSVIVIGT